MNENIKASFNLLNEYPPVLSVKQVAEILVISHNTTYNLLRSGAIHSVRVGRTYRIPLEAVIDYLCKH
ncbi:MAG: helix-turn-helix domain-containing protein [Oscillospiraceae bacterium]|nr:helix-turn-helix domain-containing protein [Oscillospiraceae bacterium]